MYLGSCIEVFRSVLNMLENEDLFWVNPLSCSRFDNKIKQLNVAAELGLLIPETIVSNNIEDIRNFFHKYDGNVVYKPFLPLSWKKGDTDLKATTTKISIEHLQDEEIITSCPGIYQRNIEKLYEVRVAVIGKSCFAIKLDSQANEKTIDWRLPLYFNPFPVKKISLPMMIEQKIHNFMSKFNLVFGCIDFIVNEKNEWIFLENNFMGQFLWMEECCSELHLLDAFSKFLISKDPNFKYDEADKYALSLENFKEEVPIEECESSVNHVLPVSDLISIEP